MSSHDHVSYLTDVTAIEQLKYRYMRALDTKHWDDFADTFTEDVVGGTWPTFDPSLPTAQTSEFPYFAAVYGTLFDVTKTGTLTPDLATAYTVSTDGKTVTIDLRPGAVFSDGSPFGASAVKWNIEVISPSESGIT